MPSFRNLLALATAISATHFAPDAEGRPLCAWFPSAPDILPDTASGYSLEICNCVHRGPSRDKTRDVLGNLQASEHRITLHLRQGDPPDGLPWLPQEQTTLLLGYELATAESYRIIDWQDLAGILELSLEKFIL